MREIKFRVWDKENKEWVKWHKTPGIIFASAENSILERHPQNEHLVLCQYTGLKDKNGKEIYEGNIVVNSRGKKQQIHWDDEPHGEPCLGYELDKHGTYEIIGNIYENPKLWK